MYKILLAAMLIATLSQNNIKKKEKYSFLLHHSALADKMNKNKTLWKVTKYWEECGTAKMLILCWQEH